MSEEPLRFLCCHGNRRLDGESLSPAPARWIGKNVNVACPLWQLLLCSSGIQTDNHSGLIYFCVPCS